MLMPEFGTEKISEDGEARDRPFAVFPDGTKITMVQELRGRHKIFSYQNAEYFFQFHASRWDEDFHPRDTWIVELGYALKELDASGVKIRTDDWMAIGERMDTALRSWPAGRDETDIPVKKVRFHMALWPRWEKGRAANFELPGRSMWV